MKIEANTVDEYIAKAPEERQDTLLRLRRVLLEHLPEGYVEELSYGMPGYVVPYTLYPPGSDMDMAKMSKIRVDDLQLRPDIYAQRLKRRASLRDTINASMPDVDKNLQP